MKLFARIALVLSALAGLVLLGMLTVFGPVGTLLVLLSLKSIALSPLEWFSRIHEQPQPWEVIAPGNPLPEYSTPYVLQQGTGEEVISAAWGISKATCGGNRFARSALVSFPLQAKAARARP